MRPKYSEFGQDIGYFTFKEALMLMCGRGPQCASFPSAWLAEHGRAFSNYSAKGVFQDAISDLELIRAAGIEGLEPVFELLESAIEDETEPTSQPRQPTEP